MDLAPWRATLVLLSKDTAAQAASHRARDGLRSTLLSDPELKVIKRLGLLHRGWPQYVTVRVFGIPLGVPTGIRDMAIPTTVLLDDAGVVLWIDQATDYRDRSDEARVTAALNEHFGARS